MFKERSLYSANNFFMFKEWFLYSASDFCMFNKWFLHSPKGFYMLKERSIYSANDFYMFKEWFYIQQAALKKSPVNSHWLSQHHLRPPKSFIQWSQWPPLSRCNNTFTNFDSFANSFWAIKHLLFVLGPFYPNKSFFWYSRIQWRLIFWQVILSILNLHMCSFNRYF